MSLTNGTRLGPYEIVAAIGAGGMGEVYRARDTRLDRIVAIKVLPELLAADPQFRERFDREARAVAALNHPHICTLHDIGEARLSDPRSPTPDPQTIQFLVMEYLQGETVAVRLQKGALPLHEALTLAIQIASALDAAHRAGITHRDLKPGNVMLTKASAGHQGAPQAKLLDFGLAKIRVSAVAGSNASMLPTAEADLTARGTIQGTFQYMAPEQIEGDEADARTDLFAFGVVLYEMLAGKRAFEGKTTASLFGAILKEEPPPIAASQPLTPPLLDHTVRRCLAKDPNERWQSAGDLTQQLKWIADTGSQVGVPVGTAQASSTIDVARVVRRERLVWGSALTSVALVAALIAAWALRSPPPPRELRLEITTPPTSDPASLAISPDGQKVVFVATSEGQPRLWVRSLDTVSARPLAGTDGAMYPFWSQDNRSVGFSTDSKLKRIDVDSGAVQVLAGSPVARGGAWNRDGTIVFAPQGSGPLFRISSTGGEPAPVTRLAPQQTNHRFPQFLPDGRHFLFYVLGTPDVRGIYVGQLEGSETRRLLDADTAAVYAPSGHVLFGRQGTLFAQSFDPVRLTLSGNPFALAEQVVIDAVSANLAAVSASATGPVVYRTGAARRTRQFTWFDRSSKELGRVGDPHEGLHPSLSPDGRLVAVQQTVNGNIDIWVLELGRGFLSRFTSDTALDIFPLWSPNGRHLVFSSNRKGAMDLYQKAARVAGTEDLVLSTAQSKQATDWSPDGRFLLYRSLDPKTGYDLWALPMEGERKPLPVAQTSFDERDGQFSPDGQWIAFQSNESGRYEIYVQPFPGPGGKSQVSTSGGAQVRWRQDGRELFYIALDGRLMAVTIRLDTRDHTVEPGAAVPLFATRVGGAVQSNFRQQYVVSPDGQRFLMNTVTEEAAVPITVVLNWAAGGKK